MKLRFTAVLNGVLTKEGKKDLQFPLEEQEEEKVEEWLQTAGQKLLLIFEFSRTTVERQPRDVETTNS